MRAPLKKSSENPVTQAETKYERADHTKWHRSVLAVTIYVFTTLIAVTVLVATLVLPVLQIYGTSMEPNLKEGDVVLSVKGNDFAQGDIIAFYYNNKVLVKRVIARSGDVVDIDENGNVTVNDQTLDEPYLDDSEKILGQSDIDYPFQVPDGRVFVMGDHRSTSVDSRSLTIGCISEDQVIGRIAFRLWPLSSVGSPT